MSKRIYFVVVDSLGILFHELNKMILDEINTNKFHLIKIDLKSFGPSLLSNDVFLDIILPKLDIPKRTLNKLTNMLNSDDIDINKVAHKLIYNE